MSRRISTALSPLGLFLELEDGGKKFLRNIIKTSYLSTRLHGITSQKTVIFTATCTGTYNCHYYETVNINSKCNPFDFEIATRSFLVKLELKGKDCTFVLNPFSYDFLFN